MNVSEKAYKAAEEAEWSPLSRPDGVRPLEAALNAAAPIIVRDVLDALEAKIETEVDEQLTFTSMSSEERVALAKSLGIVVRLFNQAREDL